MKGYRTILVNVLAIVTLALADKDVLNLISPEHMKYAVAGLAILNMVMRTLTTTRVGESGN